MPFIASEKTVKILLFNFDKKNFARTTFHLFKIDFNQPYQFSVDATH